MITLEEGVLQGRPAPSLECHLFVPVTLRMREHADCTISISHVDWPDLAQIQQIVRCSPEVTSALGHRRFQWRAK